MSNYIDHLGGVGTKKLTKTNLKLYIVKNVYTHRQTKKGWNSSNFIVSLMIKLLSNVS